MVVSRLPFWQRQGELSGSVDLSAGRGQPEEISKIHCISGILSE